MPELTNKKVVSFPFYQLGNWGTRCIQIQAIAKRRTLNLTSVSCILTERLFFLLVTWMCWTLFETWSVAFFMFRLQNRWHLSSCSAITNTFTKRKYINGFPFQIKNLHWQKVHLQNLQSLWKAVLFYPKYCNCSLNLHSKYWKPVTLKDRIALFIIIIKKKKNTSS